MPGLKLCPIAMVVWSLILLIVALASPPLAAQGSENVNTVRAIYAAFGRGDTQRVLDGMADDVNWEIVGPQSECECYGPRQGKAAVAEFFRAGRERHDYIAFEPREMYSSDDVVIVVGSQTLLLRATKREFKSDWVHVIRIAGGKMTSFREFSDTAGYLQASR